MSKCIIGVGLGISPLAVFAIGLGLVMRRRHRAGFIVAACAVALYAVLLVCLRIAEAMR